MLRKISVVFYTVLITSHAFCVCDHKLHVADAELKLCTKKNTTPSLNVQIGDTVYYANMTTDNIPMNSNTQHKLRTRLNNIIYNIYDGSEELLCTATQGLYDIGLENCVKTSIVGSLYGYYDFNGSKGNVNNFGLVTPGSWGVKFNFGNIVGISTCNGISGNEYSPTDQNFEQQPDAGKYCWCKITTPAVSQWVFEHYKFTSASQCKSNCAYNCGYFACTDASLRTGLYGSVQK